MNNRKFLLQNYLNSREKLLKKIPSLDKDRRIEMEWSTRHPDNYTDYQNNERFSERNRCKCIKEVDPWFQEGKFYEYREKIENPDEVYVYYDRGLHLQFNEGIFKDYFLDRDSIIDSILRK